MKSKKSHSITSQPLIPFHYLPQQLKNSLTEAYNIAQRHSNELREAESASADESEVSKQTGKPVKKQKNPCKTRYSWTLDQKKHLDNFYKINPLPSLAMREELAKDLGVGVKSIQFWFQNRRCHDTNKIKRERGRPPLGFKRVYHMTHDPVVEVDASLGQGETDRSVRAKSV